MVHSPVSVCDDLLDNSEASKEITTMRLAFTKVQSSSALLEQRTMIPDDRFSIKSNAIGESKLFLKSKSLRNIDLSGAKLVGNRFDDSAEKARNLLSNSMHGVNAIMNGSRHSVNSGMNYSRGSVNSGLDYSRHSVNSRMNQGTVKINKSDLDDVMKVASERDFRRRSMLDSKYSSTDNLGSKSERGLSLTSLKWSKQNSQRKIDSLKKSDPLTPIGELVEKSDLEPAASSKSSPNNSIKAASERGISSRMPVSGSKKGKSLRNVFQGDAEKVATRESRNRNSSPLRTSKGLHLSKPQNQQLKSPSKSHADRKVSSNGKKSPPKIRAVHHHLTTACDIVLNQNDSLDFIIKQAQNDLEQARLGSRSRRSRNAKTPPRKSGNDVTDNDVEKKRIRNERLSDPTPVRCTNMAESGDINRVSPIENKSKSQRHLKSMSPERKSLFAKIASDRNVTGFEDEELDKVFSPDESIKKHPIPLEISLSKVDGEGWPNRLLMNPKKSVSPKEYFIRLLNLVNKPYCTYEALKSGYYSEPTNLQLSSCGSYLNDIVCKSRDSRELEEYLSCGVSLNPTNEYGDSLVHQLCRRGDEDLVSVVLKCFNKVIDMKESPRNAVSPFQISNFMGRTPLHETCCSPKTRFRIVDIILRCDPYLLIVTDQHGYTPLDYISIDQWPKWIVYLNAKFHEYFREKSSMEPPLARQELNSCSIPVSQSSLSPEMAYLVATGQLSPKDARKFIQTKNSQWNVTQISDQVHYFDHIPNGQIKEGRPDDEKTVSSPRNNDEVGKNKLLQTICSSSRLFEDELDDYAYYIRNLPRSSPSQEEK